MQWLNTTTRVTTYHYCCYALTTHYTSCCSFSAVYTLSVLKQLSLLHSIKAPCECSVHEHRYKQRLHVWVTVQSTCRCGTDIHCFTANSSCTAMWILYILWGLVVPAAVVITVVIAVMIAVVVVTFSTVVGAACSPSWADAPRATRTTTCSLMLAGSCALMSHC